MNTQAREAPTTLRASLTHHAEVRVRQRGYREGDIPLILGCGTYGNEAVVLTNADAEREIRDLKARIHRIERLRGTAVILANSAVVSVYRPGRVRLRQFLGR